MDVALTAYCDTWNFLNRQVITRVHVGTDALRSAALSDEDLYDLVEAIAEARDRQAFALLFRYFAPRLKAFGIRQGSAAQAAEELAQETMLTVWRKAATFDRNKATVATWVYTILRNRRIDMFRRNRFTEVELSEASDRVSQHEAADEYLGRLRAGEAIKQAMAALPREQIVVIEKAFFEDKSHSVVAEELNLPLGTVKSRIRLALTRLRGVLAEKQV